MCQIYKYQHRISAINGNTVASNVFVRASGQSSHLAWLLASLHLCTHSLVRKNPTNILHLDTKLKTYYLFNHRKFLHNLLYSLLRSVISQFLVDKSSFDKHFASIPKNLIYIFIYGNRLRIVLWFNFFLFHYT